ncbi:cell adhesion molecule Dscam1-like isoform X3 [Ornithodoros turicata]|uniref:cell adhesion molecule Dscam1-like isoform X3 n=1 Tax=Ornithodoros turicata TaxID=34597 RepID=UPI00313A4564
MKCVPSFCINMIQVILLLAAPGVIQSSTVPPKIRPFSFPKVVSRGDKVTVTCSALKGTPPISFSWSKDSQDLSSTANIRFKSDADFSIAVINPTDESSSGNYTCIVKNIYGFDSYSAYLEVEAPPYFHTTHPDTNVVNGGTVKLHCHVLGSPAPRIEWKKTSDKITDELLLTNGRITVQRNGTLIIQDVTPGDRGKYTCTADNGIGSVAHTLSLHVRVPARFEEKNTVVTARRSEVTRMKCQANGDQPLSITWSKGNVRLDKRTSARYEVFETMTSDGLISELVVRDTERSDGALYTCHTENKYGKDDRKVKLIVQEVPGPPQDVRIRDVWSRSASVTWSPSYSGNSPISKYVVQYWRDHGTAHRLEELEVTGSMNSAMIRELLPGTAYVLNMVAENAIGRGEPSRTVVFHTGEEEPEAAPVDIIVEMKGPSTAFVSWKAPPREHWNGNLQGYYIGYRPRDSELPFSYRRVEASNNVSHEHLLSGLQRGTEYAFIIKAYNSAGSGPASQEKIVKTMDGDVPEAPKLFVTAVTADTMSLRWVMQSSSDVTGYNIHYRQEGGTWLELPIVKTANNTYTVTSLHSGSIYQVYVTASNVLGRGDPSPILMVQTERIAAAGETSAVEQANAEERVPLYFDMALMIPAGAIFLAVLVILVSTCICVKKLKQTSRPVPEILRYDSSALNTGTMMSQRYVEMEKMSDQDVAFPTSYNTSTLRNGTEHRDTKDRQEMKTYVPKNPMKDRPLPQPENSPLRHDDHYYDSAQ